MYGLAGPTSQFLNGTHEFNLKTDSGQNVPAHGPQPLSYSAPVGQSAGIWRVMAGKSVREIAPLGFNGAETSCNHLRFFKFFVLRKTAANVTEISRKHVFPASNRNIIENRVTKEKLEQIFT